MLFHGNCKVKCISIGFEGKIAPIHLFTKTKSHCTNLIKVNSLPFVEESENLPKSDKYLGVSEKEEARTAQRHKRTRVQTPCWRVWHRQPWQGRTGDPGEAGQGQRRAFYSSLFSGLLCWKRGTAFWEPLILVRHLPCWHKSCLCKARALKNWSDANLRQRFTPHRNKYPQLCKQKDSALLVSISRLARTGGSRDADWTDGLNSLVWKNSVGCWDLWLFAELPPSQAPMVGVRGWLWKNPHCSATTVPAKSIWHSCISVIDNISYAHCYILPWESPSIQVNVFKSVWCSQSQWFLVPLNGREQRYSLESRRLREIASEAEELLLFPWLGQHFLSEMRRWEESSTCHILITAFTIKCFCSWKNTRMAQSFLCGKRMNVHWASVILLSSFSLMNSERLELLQLFDTAVPFP